MIDEPALGLFGAIAIHSTLLGPAAGGCRVCRYPDRAGGLDAALQLSRGMTYKNAMAGLPLGGGKAVLTIAEGVDRERAIRAFGRAVQDRSGRYVIAEDVGTSENDMRLVAEETRLVCGLPASGCGAAGGDPSPSTALGVFLSIEAAVSWRLGYTLVGARVAVQGVGSVGGAQCRMLVDAGAKVLIADTDEHRVHLLAKVLGVRPCPTEKIRAADVDVFAPCALNGTRNGETVSQLRAAIVCAAANNKLADPGAGPDSPSTGGAVCTQLRRKRRRHHQRSRRMAGGEPRERKRASAGHPCAACRGARPRRPGAGFDGRGRGPRRPGVARRITSGPSLSAAL